MEGRDCQIDLETVKRQRDRKIYAGPVKCMEGLYNRLRDCEKEVETVKNM